MRYRFEAVTRVEWTHPRSRIAEDEDGRVIVSAPTEDTVSFMHRSGFSTQGCPVYIFLNGEPMKLYSVSNHDGNVFVNLVRLSPVEALAALAPMTPGNMRRKRRKRD